MRQYNINLKADSRYDPNARPTVINEFSTAAFRFGHSLIRGTIQPVCQTRSTCPAFNLSDAFLDKSRHYVTGDHGKYFKYQISGAIDQPWERLDRIVTDQVTNQLFKINNRFGMDLAARNIQRGRDHGIATFNQARKACNLPKVDFFSGTPAFMDQEAWTKVQSHMKKL